ncbi:hypothetical protein [uncultured Pseudacidovorax sp.]|uniref:hypothetical protein n=1 Tax=uncultured Pseudacidovorax sp. TaxID=679313 RepID=UPI0025D89524|nr:hypothetical protein [uncultured Pseudacidovorax sp.]
MFLHLIVIAWLYVAVMMAVAEATNTNGSLLGAIVTFVLYGLLPMGIVGYILSTPARRRARRAREAAEDGSSHPEPEPTGSVAPDQGGEAPADAPVAPVRKED